MRLKIIVLFICICPVFLHGQSFFKPLPKPQAKISYGLVSPFSTVPPNVPLPIPTKDSTIKAFRPIVNLAAYGEPGDFLMSGAGVSYQSLTFQTSTQKYYCNYSISLLGFAGGSVAPNTPSQIARVGIMFGVWNNKIMAGPCTDGKRVMAAVGIGISLNN